MKSTVTFGRWSQLVGLFVVLQLPMAADANVCPASKEVQRAESGSARISIVELYTSEGCNSCPPADKWFGGLNRSGGASQPFIPLAFHVDYWDYIGWRDRFAQAKFAAQQRAMVQAAGKRTVYTPQVFLDGADVGLWSSGRVMANAASAVRASDAVIKLNVEATRRTNAELHVSVQVLPAETAAMPPNDLVVYLAVVEQNLSSSVKAGENKNVKLEHAHTVRELIGPLSVAGLRGSEKLGPALLGRVSALVVLDSAWKIEDLSVVAYAQQRGSLTKLQAVALPLCDKKS